MGGEWESGEADGGVQEGCREGGKLSGHALLVSKYGRDAEGVY